MISTRARQHNFLFSLLETEAESGQSGSGGGTYTPAPSRPCSLLIVCLYRRVRNQIAKALMDREEIGHTKTRLPKKAHTVSEHVDKTE